MIAATTLLHRGSIEAVGFLVETSLVGEVDARRRVIDLWEPGATVCAVTGGFVVRLPATRRVRTGAVAATPLTVHNGVLVTGPVVAIELRTASSGLARIIGGRVHHEALSTSVDIASWLDLSSFTTASVESLGERPAPIAAPAPGPSVEALLPVRGAPSKERDALVESLARGDRTTGASGFFARVLQALARWIAASQRRARSVMPPSAQSALGWLGRFLDRLVDAIVPDAVARWLARQHEKYLAELFESFERGDIDEVLRRAIPLGGDTGESLRRMPPLGLPPRRTAFDPLEGRGQRTSTSLSLSTDLFQELSNVYRSAFERLKREGRVRDAAFVLARLLHKPEEAVAYVESTKELRLAAELAEGFTLAPGLIVRQWWLAGDHERALLLARRHGAFADAIARLHRKAPDAADALRGVWVRHLEEAGDLAGALAVLRQAATTTLREDESRLLVKALERGGVLAATALPRMLALVPESWASLERLARALLQESAQDPSVLHAYAGAVADGLSTTSKVDSLRALAKPLLRRSFALADTATVKRLLPLVGDALLVNDLPEKALTAPVPTPLDLRLDASDCGTTPVLDAAVLSDGRVLVALGESGVKLLTRDGRLVVHFDVPAHHLVVSDHGDRALVLAQRGETSLVSKLDLIARTSAVWGELRLARWAETYDGAAWIVAETIRHRSSGNPSTMLHVLDMTGNARRSVWSVDVPGEILALQRSGTSLAAAVAEASLASWSVWRWDLPTLTLRARTALPRAEERVPVVLAVAAEGQSALVSFVPNEPSRVLLLTSFGGEVRERLGPVQLLRGARAPLAIDGSRVAWCVPTEEGAFVQCGSPSSERWHSVRLLGTNTVRLRLRLEGPLLIACDELGRVVAVDVERGSLVRSLRI